MQSQDLTCEKQRLFPTQRTWQWSMNMTKMLTWRFRQCLGTFMMFLVKGFSQGVFLDIYMTTFSESVILKLQNLWASSFFSECSKFQLHFKNAVKNWEKVLCFSRNCMSIGIAKLSLLRRGYFSLAAIVLRSSLKICRVNKKQLYQLNRLELIIEYDKGALMLISTVLGHV